MSKDNPSKSYRVQLCQQCEHPGGQHLGDYGCRLCSCDGWVEGRQSWWSDLHTDAAVARATHMAGSGGEVNE